MLQKTLFASSGPKLEKLGITTSLYFFTTSSGLDVVSYITIDPEAAEEIRLFTESSTTMHSFEEKPKCFAAVI